jgi:hypothetical protein
MEVSIVVVLALAEVLEEMGFDEKKVETVTNKICEHIEEEVDPVPDEHESFVLYINDDDLLHDAIKSAKVDVEKFTAIIDKISAENNDTPVVISF